MEPKPVEPKRYRETTRAEVEAYLRPFSGVYDLDPKLDEDAIGKPKLAVLVTNQGDFGQ
jgi:hypothetical protein